MPGLEKPDDARREAGVDRDGINRIFETELLKWLSRSFKDTPGKIFFRKLKLAHQSRELHEQRVGILQIRGIKAFREPVVNGSE